MGSICMSLPISDSLRALRLLALFASCISVIFPDLLTEQLHFYQEQDEAGLSAEA